MEDEIRYLVSNFDIQRKFKRSKKVKIMVYSALNNVTNILDILPVKISACFILLRTTEQSGHWTCLCRNDKSIYYMDSYGVSPDGELKHIAKNVRYELGENTSLLTNLLHNLPSGYTFAYNKMQFQQYHNDVNTCGKWCTVFAKCIFDGLSLSDFQRNMSVLKKKYKVNYDTLVCILWDAF